MLAVIALGVPLLIATTGGSGAPGAAPSTDGGVTVQNFDYVPPELTVKVGTEVTWTNEDSAPHTATADDGSFDTDTIEGGNSGSATLDEPGTFTYFCSFHAFMKGSVTVEE